MKYQDTVLTHKQIKFKPLPVEYVEDGKVDIIVSIPLTQLLEAQAKQSFFLGISECLKWFTGGLLNKNIPTKEDVEKQFKQKSGVIKLTASE